MPEIHFPALNLNLLRLFDALAEERSVTRAGARLGLTQSAVSHGLNRLRHALRDELFIRTPDGMRPTARAQEMAPRLRQGLYQLQLALSPTAFAPGETQRRFMVSASTYICTIFMPKVLAELRRAAPTAEIRLQTPSHTMGDDIQSGRLDIAIGNFGRAGPGFERETLFEEATVWAIRADHKAARSERLTLGALARLPHVILASGEDDHTVDGLLLENGLERRVALDDRDAFAEALASRGLKRTIGATVPDAQSALAIVGETDMAALVPKRLATAHAGEYGVKLFDPPYSSTAIVIEAIWRRDLSQSPPLEWFRQRLRAAAARL
jgi:DNA-binding transcriptional LysR family regulator